MLTTSGHDNATANKAIDEGIYVSMLLRNIAIISYNNEIYEELVPMTKGIPHFAVIFENGEASLTAQESLYRLSTVNEVTKGNIFTGVCSWGEVGYP